MVYHVTGILVYHPESRRGVRLLGYSGAHKPAMYPGRSETRRIALYCSVQKSENRCFSQEGKNDLGSGPTPNRLATSPRCRSTHIAPTSRPDPTPCLLAPDLSHPRRRLLSTRAPTHPAISTTRIFSSPSDAPSPHPSALLFPRRLAPTQRLSSTPIPSHPTALLRSPRIYSHRLAISHLGPTPRIAPTVLPHAHHATSIRLSAHLPAPTSQAQPSRSAAIRIDEPGQSAPASLGPGRTCPPLSDRP